MYVRFCHSREDAESISNILDTRLRGYDIIRFRGYCFLFPLLTPTRQNYLLFAVRAALGGKHSGICLP